MTDIERLRQDLGGTERIMASLAGRLAQLEKPAEETIESVYGTATPPKPEGDVFQRGDDGERLFRVPVDGDTWLGTGTAVYALAGKPYTGIGKRFILRKALTFMLRENGDVRRIEYLERYIGSDGRPHLWVARGPTANCYPILELVEEPK